MKQPPISTWLLTVAALISVAAAGMTSYAQRAVATEQLALPLGAVFEIIADTDIANPNYNWIISHERTFLEADRGKVYRTRLTLEGEYTVDAEVRSQIDDSQRVQKKIVIDVDEANEQPVRSTQSIIQTVPTIDEKGRVLFSPTRSIVQIIPTHPDIQEIGLDIDPTVDVDGDGNPTNDNDVAGSFFSSQRTPIHLWLAKGEGEQIITINATLADGRTESESIRVMSRDRARAIDEEENRQVEVVAVGRGEGAVGFSVNFPSAAPQIPLLYHWDFGDGTQSLLDMPIHTYVQNGRYNVRVRIRDLTTGQQVEDRTAVIDVESVPSTVTEPDEPVDDGTPGALGSIVGLIVKGLIVIIIAVAVGFGAIFLIAKIRKSKGLNLQKKFEIAEKKLVGDNESPDIATSEPAPMEIIDAEEVEVEVESEPEKQPAAESPPAEGPVPDWLQPAPADRLPPVEPQYTPEPIVPTEPESVAEPAPQPDLSSENGPTPDWLKPPADTEPPIASTTESEPQSQPQPAPLNEPIAITDPEPVPMTEPTPETTPQETGPLPDWLQPQEHDATEPLALQPALSPEPTSTPQQPPIPQPPSQQTAQQNTDEETDEAKRERNRRKRQRYRENVKKRKQENGDAPTPASTEPVAEPPQLADDEPIAFIQADDITPAPPSPPAEGQNPPENEEKKHG